MDRASQGQIAEPYTPDHHCDTIGGGKGGGKGICFNSRLFFCLICVVLDLTLYSDGVGGVQLGLCSIMADSDVDMESRKGAFLVLSQKVPGTELGGMTTLGEDRPIRGSCWPLCGLRSLGMFMSLLKLQKGSPVPGPDPTGIGVHIQST
jgi:hypothetical protein